MTIDISKDPSRIAGMFDAIAGRYDLLNHLLSGGLDLYWRRRALAALRLTSSDVLLDVCTGTGDVAIAARRRPNPPSRVIGIDFAGGMLQRGHAKVARERLTRAIRFVRGDASSLPIRDQSADVVTVAFGIRNVSDPAAVCRELVRTLRPGGRLAILEFAIPQAAVVRSLYLFYFRRILPLIGRAISGHAGAYSYLPASVGGFATPHDFQELLKCVGFVDVRAQPLTVGTVQLYLGIKP
jgi:demethylmenaquinone methyltransferase/2-methoxy-6-polyprenyl-1,4-benzoquinol methylase